jgi:hypothetical protein
MLLAEANNIFINYFINYKYFRGRNLRWPVAPPKKHGLAAINVERR